MASASASAGRRFAAFYARSFERHPYITLGVANGTLGAIADGLAQGFEKVSAKGNGKGGRDAAAPAAAPAVDAASPGSDTAQQLSAEQTQAQAQGGYDPVRSLRFVAFNIGMAPLLFHWNQFIELRFPLRPAGAGVIGAAGGAAARVSLGALAKRVAVDQGLFAPFGLALFTGAMGAMEGKSLSEIRQKYSDVFIPALIANWKIWPLMQTVNFRFMPLRYRVPFTGTMGVLWTIYLSLLNMAQSN